MSAEYFRKVGFESNGISGTVTVPGAGGAAGACCAFNARGPDTCTNNAAPAIAAITKDENRFTKHLRAVPLSRKHEDTKNHIWLIFVVSWLRDHGRLSYSKTERDELRRVFLATDRDHYVLLAVVQVGHHRAG